MKDIQVCLEYQITVDNFDYVKSHTGLNVLGISWGYIYPFRYAIFSLADDSRLPKLTHDTRFCNSVTTQIANVLVDAMIAVLPGTSTVMP